MKNIFLIFLILSFALQLKAQFVRDEWGDVIPFSLTEKYKDRVNTNEIHSLVLDSFKNDSLFFKHNNIKSYKEAGNTYVYGFGVDSSIVFRDYAKKIEIEEGTLWIMTIESKTAQSIGIKITNFDLPENVYFTIYPGTIPYLIEDPEVGFKEDITDGIKHSGLEHTINDSKAILEYFVPKGLQVEPNLTINKIIYGFKGLGKPGEIIDYKKYKEQNSKDSSSLLISKKEPFPLYCEKKERFCEGTLTFQVKLSREVTISGLPLYNLEPTPKSSNLTQRLKGTRISQN